MADKEIKIDIEGDASKLEAAVKTSVESVNQFTDDVKTLNEGLGETVTAVDETNSRLSDLKNKLKDIITGGFTGFIDHAVYGLTLLIGKLIIWGVEAKKAFSLEKGFADTNRMFEDTSENIQKLDGDLKRLSTQKLAIPIEEVQHLAKVAGGMGKESKDVAEFIQTASEAALSFNMSAEEMMTRLGGIQAAIGLTNKQLPTFTDKVKIAADSIGGMTTEADIMAVLADGVAQAGKEFGLLSGQTIAYASTLLSTGTIVSDASGSLFNLFFSLKNLNGQSKEFKATLTTLGMSTEQFAEDIRTNPVEAINGLLAKLSELSGESKISAITGLVGGNTTRQAALLNLVNNLDTLKQQLKNTSDAELYAGKVHEAYEKKLDTASGKIEMMKNALTILAAALMNPFLPAIKLGIDAITWFSEWLRRGVEEHPYLEILLKTVQLFLSLAGAIHIVRWLLMPFLALLGMSIVSAFQLATGLRAVLNTSLAEFFVSATASMRSFLAAQIASNTAFGTMLASSRAFFAATIGRVAQLTASLWAMVTAQIASNVNFAAMLVSAQAFVATAIARIAQVAASLWGLVTAQVAINISFATSLAAVRAFALGAVAYLSTIVTSLIAIATTRLSFGVIFAGFATGIRGLIGGFAGLGAAATTLISIFKFLVGSLTGLALTFLALAITFASDQTVKFGGVTAKVSEFFKAAWQVSANNVKSIFNSLFDDVNRKSKDSAIAAYSPWDNFFQSIKDSLYDFANRFIMTFDLIGKAIGTLLAGGNIAEFLQNFDTKRDYLAEFTTAVTAQVNVNQANPEPSGGDEQRNPSAGINIPPPETEAELKKAVDAKTKILKSELDAQLAAIKTKQTALKDAHDLELKQLDNALNEQKLKLEQQVVDELITEQQKNEQLLTLKKDTDAKKIELERRYIDASYQLDKAAITAKITAARAEAVANVSKPSATSLAGIIAGGEGKGYNDYNKGTRNGTIIPADKPVDLTALTIGEIQARQALDIANKDRLGAVGKYQVIAVTLKEAVAALKLTADTQFDAATQEKIFTYLVGQKRPALQNYITGASNDSQAAQLDAAKEFRSIADPRTGLTYADKGQSANKASINTEQFQPVLAQARSQYQQNTAAGMDKTTAYNQAITGAGLTADAQAEAVSKLKVLTQEQVTLEQEKNTKLKALGIEEQNNTLEQNNEALSNKKQRIDEEKQLTEQRLQAEHDAAIDAVDLKEEAANTELALGNINQAEHLQKLRGFSDERLKVEQTLLDEKRKLYGKDQLALQQNLDDKARIEREDRLKRQQQLTQDAKNQQEIFDGMMSPFKNAMQQMTNSVLTGQQTISNALKNASNSMVLSYASTFAQERAMQAAQWAWKLSGLIATKEQEEALKKGDVIWAVMLAAKEKAILAAQWTWETLGFARKEATKRNISAASVVWNSLMWVRDRIAKSAQWAWEAAGTLALEARKRAIKTASAAWDNLMLMRHKIRLGALWLWERLGFAEKEGEKIVTKVVSETAQTGAQVAGDTTRTISAVTAAQTKKQVDSQTASQSIMAKAYDAAAGVYSSLSAIPYVGWILAPIAAAATLVAVLGWSSLVGSAKQGEWQVEQDGSPFILHEKESVLPAWAAEKWRNMVSKADQLANPADLVNQATGAISGLITGQPVIPPSVHQTIQQEIAGGALPTALPPAPPDIMQFIQQHSRAREQAHDSARKNQELQAIQTGAMVAANQSQEKVSHRHELHMHTVNFADLLRQNGKVLVKVLSDEHRKFNKINK